VKGIPWVTEGPRPIGAVHECARLGLAGGQIGGGEVAEWQSADPVFGRVIALEPDPVQGEAEAVLGQAPADRAVPPAVMPGRT
jgi:hypothetical protein